MNLNAYTFEQIIKNLTTQILLERIMIIVIFAINGVLVCLIPFIDIFGVKPNNDDAKTWQMIIWIVYMIFCFILILIHIYMSHSLYHLAHFFFGLLQYNDNFNVKKNRMTLRSLIFLVWAANIK